VGRILASDQHNSVFRGEAADKVRDFGKTLLSANDNVILLFTEDLAKILDSETYGDSDPYFREFPIYGRPGQGSRAPVGRTDEGQNLGELYIFKGLVTVVARVEGLAPTTPKASEDLKKGKSGLGLEPVSYVGRITYSEDVVELTDQVFCFLPLSPGPERVLDTPALEAPDSYVPLN
jgi:hypothetical protein